MATTLEEARSVWKAQSGKFRRKARTRIVFLGDGRGFSASNLIDPTDPNYLLARSTLDTRDFFPVKGSRNVQPMFNLPVKVVQEVGDPFEKIEGIVDTFGSYTAGGSSITNAGPHGAQHQYGGGDEVYVSSETFLPGLVKPTNPPSMKVQVYPFVYFWKSWNLFPFVTSEDMTQYLPNQNNRWVVITLDQISARLRYNIGPEFINNSTFIQIIDGQGAGYNYMPPPPGNEIPLVGILLNSTTTTIDWNAHAGVNNMVQLRMHLATPSLHILERIEQLEGITGNRPNLAMTGAAESTADEHSISVVDGGDIGGY